MKEVYDNIRKARKEKKLTLADLGKMTGLSTSYLSQVERQNCDVTLTSLAKIASALDIDIRTFFQSGTADTYVTQKEERRELDTGNKMLKYYKLSGNFKQREIEPLIVVCKPHAHATWESHVGEEFFYILEGEIIFQVDDKTYLLKEGDAIHFPSHLLHAIKNQTDKEVKMLSTINQLIS